jgi:hypothetical protein
MEGPNKGIASEQIEISDTTLRDGEQTYGVVFSNPEKLHDHDPGMAVANRVAAVRALQDSLVSVTVHKQRQVYQSTPVNGLGERAGNAPLEAVLSALEFSLGVELGLRTDMLAGLCGFVARAPRGLCQCPSEGAPRNRKKESFENHVLM